MPSAAAAGTSIGRSHWRYPRRRRSNQQADSRTLRVSPQNRTRGVARQPPAGSSCAFAWIIGGDLRDSQRTTPPATRYLLRKGDFETSVPDGHAARDCDRSVSSPQRRHSDHDSTVTAAAALAWRSRWPVFGCRSTPPALPVQPLGPQFRQLTCTCTEEPPPARRGSSAP